MIVHVDYCHIEMLNWMEENITTFGGYTITPRLHGYGTVHEITFRFEKDLSHFQIRWGEEIK